MCNVLGSD